MGEPPLKVLTRNDSPSSLENGSDPVAEPFPIFRQALTPIHYSFRRGIGRVDRGASKSKFLSIVYEMRVWDLGVIPLPVSELEVTAVSPA